MRISQKTNCYREKVDDDDDDDDDSSFDVN
jgi:hypothetical protein